MSLPTMTPDRDALRSALRSSLSDVLLDLGVDNRNARPVMPQNPNHLLPQQSHLSPVTGGAFDSPLLPSRQQNLVSQSLGFPPSSLSAMRAPAHMQSATSFGITPDGILLAAAAASERSKLLEQAKASLIQQQIAEENKRLLLQKSYFNLLQQKGMPAKPACVLPQFSAMSQNTHAQPSGAGAFPGGKALEALGSSLRAKTDPYIDVSHMADPDPEDAVLRRTRGGVSEPFPEKLHRMLEEVEKEGLSDVASFYSHGRAFGVHDMDRFVSEVMPKYFKQSKWNSFARQLNLYGFIRITSGPDAGGYYHELFLKGRPSLCLHMRRVGVPQGEDRRKFRPKNKNVEPDFYSMKRITPSS